jgi:fatty acid desaturase
VVFFIGTRQNVLALLMHEQTHWLGLRSKWGDYFCELFVAYPLMVTLEGYRRVHLSHHSYYFTDDDPDYIRKQGKEWTFPQHIGYFLAVLVRDLSGMSIVNTLKGKSLSKSGSKINTKFYPPRWLRPAFLLILVTALTLTHSWTIFAVYWLLPLLTVLQGIIRIGAITEHKYNLLNPSLEESTPLIELRWWEKLLLPNLNFTLHIYHHWFPTIPASKLPEVHKLCREMGLLNEDHVFRGYAPYIRYLLCSRGESTRTTIDRTTSPVA